LDLNGQSRLSEIKAVTFSGNIRISVFPNPALNGNATIVLPQDAGRMNIMLVDFAGRVIQKWENNRESTISLSKLRRGAYTLRVMFTDSGDVISERIIVN
jgi:hypothetical protein